MDNKEIKELIIANAEDLAEKFSFYDRKEDEDLTKDKLDNAILNNIISVEEIVFAFKTALLDTYPKNELRFSNSKKIEKYEIEKQDWNNIDLVNMKMKAETITALFIAIENVLAPHISPVESSAIENTKNLLLDYLDNSFINVAQHSI